MKVAVFGNSVDSGFKPVLDKFFRFFKQNNIEIQLYKPFYNHLINNLDFTPFYTTFFHSHTDFDLTNSFIFSIGGDGTFLQTLQCIQHYDIPMVGLNSGRLGFLADIAEDEVEDALAAIFNGQFDIIERSLIDVKLEGETAQLDFNYALNEMTVLKTDSSSMINIKAYLDGEFLNNYWADGLIIATPTGSTAYSLSVGGPVLTPDAMNFVITPIAPHNLTVRPLVVPDTQEVVLKVSGRGSHFLTSLDSNSTSVEISTIIRVKKADFKLKTLSLKGHSFLSTLRNKLMWGADKRN